MMLRRDGIGGNGFRTSGAGGSSSLTDMRRYATYEGLGQSDTEIAFAGSEGIDCQCFCGLIAIAHDFPVAGLQTNFNGGSNPPFQCEMGIYAAAVPGATAVLLARTGTVAANLGLTYAPLVVPVILTAHTRYYLAVSAPQGAVVAAVPSMGWNPGDMIAFGLMHTNEVVGVPTLVDDLTGYSQYAYVPWVEAYS